MNRKHLFHVISFVISFSLLFCLIFVFLLRRCVQQRDYKKKKNEKELDGTMNSSDNKLIQINEKKREKMIKNENEKRKKKKKNNQ